MERIIVAVSIELPVEQVWQYWTMPEHIQRWNIPFADWHCPRVTNDVKTGGKFCFEMEKRDGKEGFDHAGVYDTVVPQTVIEYTLDDGRKSTIEFQGVDGNTILRESFEPEKNAPNDMQEAFCKSVLEKFKRYVEESAHLEM